MEVYDGADRYRCGRQLLILADTGGGNSCRTGVWKTELQTQLCNGFGLTVTVAQVSRNCEQAGRRTVSCLPFGRRRV